MIPHETLLLAMFPAIIAILLELINPLSEAAMLRQAEEVVARHKLASSTPAIMAEFAGGATSVTGLAPTLMSVFTAALAILHDLPPAKLFWWLYVVLLGMVFIALWIGREVAKRDFYDMAIGRVTVFHQPTIKYTTLHSLYIYLMNLLLIGACAWLLWRY